MRPLNTENDKGRRQHSSAEPSYQNIDQQRRRRGAICTLLKLKTTKTDGSTPPWSLLPDISTDDEGDAGAIMRPLKIENEDGRRQHSFVEPAA